MSEVGPVIKREWDLAQCLGFWEKRRQRWSKAFEKRFGAFPSIPGYAQNDAERRSWPKFESWTSRVLAQGMGEDLRGQPVLESQGDEKWSRSFDFLNPDGACDGILVPGDDCPEDFRQDLSEALEILDEFVKHWDHDGAGRVDFDLDPFKSDGPDILCCWLLWFEWDISDIGLVYENLIRSPFERLRSFHLPGAPKQPRPRYYESHGQEGIELPDAMAYLHKVREWLDDILRKKDLWDGPILPDDLQHGFDLGRDIAWGLQRLLSARPDEVSNKLFRMFVELLYEQIRTAKEWEFWHVGELVFAGANEPYRAGPVVDRTALEAVRRIGEKVLRRLADHANQGDGNFLFGIDAKLPDGLLASFESKWAELIERLSKEFTFGEADAVRACVHMFNEAHRLAERRRALVAESDQIDSPQAAPKQFARASESQLAANDNGKPSGQADTQHSEDFTSVLWYGTRHQFNKTQAECVKLLWAEWEKSDDRARGLSLSEKFIGERIGSATINSSWPTCFDENPVATIPHEER